MSDKVSASDSLLLQTDSSKFTTDSNLTTTPTTTKVKIKQISIIGNRKTKGFVFYRETGYKVGDSLPVENMAKTLARIQRDLINTKLFTNVLVNIKNWDDEGLDLFIFVIEKWYIIPIPIFQLADRNFNEWWIDHKRSLNRIQYGALVNWSNFRGRNETIGVSASLGFAQLFGVHYHIPYLTKNDRLGLIVELQMMRSRRMAYNTIHDKLQFVYRDRLMKKVIDFAPTLIINKNKYIRHFIEARYAFRWIDKEVSNLNQDYFLKKKNTQSVFSLEYRFDIDKRILKAYPTEGYEIKGSLTNYGLKLQKDIDMTAATLSGSVFFTLDKKNKHSTASYLKVKGSFPYKQPYDIQSGLGYDEDIVRGYELYVVDGQSYVLTKNEYRYNFANFAFKPKSQRKLDQMNQSFPFSFYVKAFLDAGYVKDRFFTLDNPLRNKWMYGGGVGIDVLMLYDKLLRFEYAVNRKGEKGLFFHLDLPF
ncbi:MAG: sorting and assembly machinery component 50 [Chitinophagales bacterium]|nr:sorting and assembly machinery component 50 [Chitinophagales bacterium]